MSDIHGVTSFTDGLTGDELERYALRLEALGFESLWLPELTGREPFATAGFVLARTSRLRVATGIANVYARDAMTAAQARQTLAELSGGRFVLGLGVSHPPMAVARGHEWISPVVKMRGYLEALRETRVQSPQPAEQAPIFVAAHGPGLLGVAAELADGAKTYLMPPEHTERAREILGPDKPLLVVLPCCLDHDGDRARVAVRKSLAVYLGLPAYRRMWKTQGLDDADFADGGSERLIQAVCAFGDEKILRDRIKRYVDAGATGVLISPLHSDRERSGGPPTRLQMLERMAPGG